MPETQDIQRHIVAHLQEANGLLRGHLLKMSRHVVYGLQSP